MKTITICFSKSRNVFFPIGGYAIRWYLGTGYSHVSYHFEAQKYNSTLVYEAVGVGLRFIEKENWLKKAEIVKSYKIEVTEEIYNKIMTICIKKAGEDYGYSQNVGVVIADIFNLSHNPFTVHNNCSELIARLLEEAGYKFYKNYNLLTPLDIEKALNET